MTRRYLCPKNLHCWYVQFVVLQYTSHQSPGMRSTRAARFSPYSHISLPEVNNMIGWMRKNNRATRVVRTLIRSKRCKTKRQMTGFKSVCTNPAVTYLSRITNNAVEFSLRRSSNDYGNSQEKRLFWYYTITYTMFEKYDTAGLEGNPWK